MRRVIVSVKREDEPGSRDLEVPADVGAAALAELVAGTLRWDSDPSGRRLIYTLEAQPPGRVLHPSECLSDAGAWDGARLVLHPYSGSTHPAPAGPPAQVGPAAPPVPPAPLGSPVSGWRPLGLTLAVGPDSDQAPDTAPKPQPPAGGFTWKRLDP